ncbi:type II toxin-antitoxin system VapC family toxin [Pedobacter sp. SD-b]|uniref:Type II toxin-antitoxin system VapC family toxin n=1 Tax=Pedobacter segetis TaxID=2793069 RepID=A0ABS1BLB5_9SPHI|nr:type II toxin-antitoxin system VapC family toxin [Pedobacter segetis]MBK0383687.1 type II toxin-antitoxin system VapC family toxin [Pedobacter segetis]
MALLIDTQVIIWLENNPNKFSKETKRILSIEDVVYFSHASIWEMSIKLKIGKLFLDENLEKFFLNFQNTYKFQPLPIKQSHIYQTEQLDLHHKDPFDRLIVAQSMIENLSIVSSDVIFDKYIDNRIW